MSDLKPIKGGVLDVSAHLLTEGTVLLIFNDSEAGRFDFPEMVDEAIASLDHEETIEGAFAALWDLRSGLSAALDKASAKLVALNALKEEIDEANHNNGLYPRELS